MAKLRTISRWLVLALLVVVALLILLHQLLAGGHPPGRGPASLPTALAPHQFIARTRPVDQHIRTLSAQIRT